MVLLKAQRLQRLAEKLGRIESRLAAADGELEAVDAVEDELREAAARTGVELTAVRRLDAATLERALWAGGRPDPGRLWTAAEVLHLDALRADRPGPGGRESRPPAGGAPGGRPPVLKGRARVDTCMMVMCIVNVHPRAEGPIPPPGGRR